ncbi:MAG: hypothetical protein ACK4TA_23360 [Saprospiraceae bacterium]
MYKQIFRWGMLLYMIIIAHVIMAQNELPPSRFRPLVISVFNNSTLLPGSGKLGFWGVPMHPGFSVGTEFRYNDNNISEWFQTAKLGYTYHRYVQHSIQLFSELGYRHHFAAFDLEGRLGIGYLHAISDAQIFELNSEGIYERKHTLGRPQGMASMSIGMGYTVAACNDLRVFLAQQFYLQTPFVNEYVPVLPSSAFHVGVAIPFFRSLK